MKAVEDDPARGISKLARLRESRSFRSRIGANLTNARCTFLQYVV
jgi:hypothetical protein